MQSPTSHQFSSSRIANVLVDAGVLSKAHAADIQRRELPIKEQLYQQYAQTRFKSEPKDKALARTDFIDMLLFLNLMRLDAPDKPLDEDAIFKALARQWELPFEKIDPLKLELSLVTGTISKSFAARHQLLPLRLESGKLVVATPNPFNREAIQDVERASKLKVSPIVSSRSDIKKLIREFFGFHRSISMAEDLFSTRGVDLGNLERFVSLSSKDDMLTDKHIVHAVNHLFTYAFDQKASDIHIEPKRDVCLVRIRIDGVLHTAYKLPKQLHNAVVSRIKNMSALDMAEKRRPQDGRIKMGKEDTEVEIRVSTIPVAFGEKVVMRIMDPDLLFQDLENLGFIKSEFETFKSLITKPFGIVMVTGPTGSGKSTTLYSSLRMLSSPEVNITTIEDPIEMVHEEFNQIAVKPAIELSFASVLRNILRQDPDIIMVGEIRDKETVNSAVQAALTGHLVLSTLHTNDAVSSLFRLMDLGMPPYLIQASLNGIVAQRLVRKVCPYCAETFEMDTEELSMMGLDVGKEGQISLTHGKGCIKCRKTGYQGRTGIFEIMPYSETLKRMTAETTDLEAMRAKAREEGMVMLRESGIRKMLSGETTYQEVLRVTWEQY